MFIFWLNIITWFYNYLTVECSAGQYGENCSSTCGRCLTEKVCHYVTGKCDEGCSPGYKGPTCETGTICIDILIEKKGTT